VGLTDPGIEKTKEVIDLGDGAYGTAGVLVGSLLFDGDNGAEAGDLVHIRSFHIADELAGIGPEAFHIAALAFCVNGIEGEGGLSAAANAGDDHELVPGDADVDVLEIVYPGTGHVYYIFFFGVKPGFGIVPDHSAKVITTNGPADSFAKKIGNKKAGAKPRP
jgi:hypothetical protein